MAAPPSFAESPKLTSSSNPFESLLKASNNDPSAIQHHYHTHRTNRNAQQAAKLLDTGFKGMTPDPILTRLLDPANDLAEVDQRHCLVFWARPPSHIRSLVAKVQDKLLPLAPTRLYLTPLEKLHLNAFEITHSRTAAEIAALEAALAPCAQRIADIPFHWRPRLVKPLLAFDAAAVALTFVPAAGEPSTVANDANRDDHYSYHHLRRDIHGCCVEAGVPVTQRYTVSSAHVTVARFVGCGEVTEGSVRAWVEGLEGVNEWLMRDFWPENGQGSVGGGEWIVGQEKGLDHRKGTLWYGGGETITLGRGF